MNQEIEVGSGQAGAMYPIRTVSKMTGVNVITLRAWENRYGLITPERKESGHRLYSQEHIDLIIRVVGLMDRGMRIGQVKTFLDSQEANEEGAASQDATQDTWRRYMEGMLSAVIRFDDRAMDDVYSEALSHYNIGTVTERLLRPLLTELGHRWESKLGSIAEEHFFGFYMRNKLGARFHHKTRNGTGRKLLMACLPGERHEVGLLMLALVLNESGYHPVVLGADLPLSEIPSVVAKIDCDAVVLSGIIHPDAEIIEKQLAQLVSAVDLPVFMGGQVSIDFLDEITRAGVHALGTDIEVGIKSIKSILKD